ncbi:MAG: hypothetical protein FWB85_01455 [Chitinispirillia bacterium]|nr:hypothetical protein [Chitinispirillia bacterium]
MRNRIAVAVLTAALLALAGCAPTIRMQVERPPNWNTSGIKRIAVMPFEHDRSRDQEHIARFLTASATTAVTQTGQFTLVSDSEIQRLQYRRESIENHVDALFSGKILDIQYRDSSYITQVYDPDTKQTYETTAYDREVTLTVTYSLERARDGSVVGTATRTARAADTQKDYNYLKAVPQLLQQCRVLAGLPRDLAPYTVVETRTLMTEKTKDKALKEKMKNAAAHVSGQNYKTALNSYMAIYGEYGTFAAIYNASIMQEALGDTRAAIDLMSQASTETGNPQARNELARLTKRLQEQETVDTDYKETVRQIDRAIAHASGEAMKILPPGARVWIVNNEKSERALASSVADGVTSALIKKSVIIVDRENSELIEREFLQQMSGGVSDTDILSAGNQAGANIIIIIAITGTGSMRRLQMRILDVEKGVPILQSDAGGSWDL